MPDELDDIQIIQAASLPESDFLKLTADFTSGRNPMDAWLRQRAWRNACHGYTAVALAVRGDICVGYFGLSASQIVRQSLPGRHRRNAPESIPVVRIGQLAVSEEYQGQGIGELLLMEALERSLKGSGQIGAAHVLVDPLDERAGCFYERYGFQSLPGIEGKLATMFLSIRTIQGLLSVQNA